MRRVKALLLAWASLWGLWLLLTWPPPAIELALGAALSLVLAVATLRWADALGDVRLNPRALLAWGAFAGVFLVALVQSNLDVARRVLSPSLPIRPGVVRVQSKLKSPLGRMILANAITLTPGTLTVDLGEDHLLIHWIDAPTLDVDSATQAIVARFERWLEVAIG